MPHTSLSCPGITLGIPCSSSLLLVSPTDPVSHPFQKLWDLSCRPSFHSPHVSALGWPSGLLLSVLQAGAEIAIGAAAPQRWHQGKGRLVPWKPGTHNGSPVWKGFAFQQRQQEEMACGSRMREIKSCSAQAQREPGLSCAALAGEGFAVPGYSAALWGYARGEGVM